MQNSLENDILKSRIIMKRHVGEAFGLSIGNTTNNKVGIESTTSHHLDVGVQLCSLTDIRRMCRVLSD